MVRIVAVDAQDEQVWAALLELRARYPDGWTLIGARMVTLYALEQGRTPPRFSLDADALVNVRLIPRGTERFSKLLLELGYELIDVSGFGHGHRFRRGGVDIDVLAPDGLNSVDRRVTVPPLHTVRCLDEVKHSSGPKSSRSSSATGAARCHAPISSARSW